MPSEIDSAPAMAFNNTNDYSEPPYGENFYPPSAPPIVGDDELYIGGTVIIVVAIFILYFAVILVSTRSRRRFSIAPENPLNLRSMGLNARVVDALPVFEYKVQSFKDELECAVCLSEFEENEKGRFLPNCKHSFHVECIDMWFLSHSTCPVCRTRVQPKTWVGNKNTDHEIFVNVELVSSGNREFWISRGLVQGETSSQPKDGPWSTTGMSSMPETAINMPGRSESFSSEKQAWLSSGSHSSKTALHSLKIMLKRGVEGRVFSDPLEDEGIETEGQEQWQPQ